MSITASLMAAHQLLVSAREETEDREQQMVLARTLRELERHPIVRLKIARSPAPPAASYPSDDNRAR
jgi:hypothetical protein